MLKRVIRSMGTDEVRRVLLAGHFELIPPAFVGNFINLALIIFTFRHTHSTAQFATITGIISIPLIGLIHFWHRNHDGKAGHDSMTLLQRAIGFAATISIIWAGIIFYLLQDATLQQVAMLGMFCAGMMAAATLSCATIPAAAYAFILPLATAIFIDFAQRGTSEFWTTNALLVSLTIVFIQVINSNYRNHIERIQLQINAAESARQSEEDAATVKLLLNDFEEHGSDWLWELDDAHCIITASARFGEAAERPVETLNSTPFLALFAACPEREILVDHMQEMRAFRDVVLPLMINNELRWWSLTGHPMSGTDGKMRLRGVASDVSAARNAEARMAYMAHYDGLTDLPNRVLFNETLNLTINRLRSNQSLAVLSIDLDHFKTINDTLGHPAGDALLREVSRRLEASVGKKDIVARMGGDEFAILIPNFRSRAVLEKMIGKIIKTLNKPVDIEKQHVITGASIGVVTAPYDGDSVDELMKKVDLALYSAKADGRNRFAFFDPGMDEAAQARRMVEIDLRAALNRDELSLYYQPLVNVESGKTVGYEALLRWQHPERGLIMPTEFVPIAEETGMIVQLGEWVIRRSLADVATWPEHLSVSVNISPVQMRSSGLISTIINALAQSGVAPERLELEITESVLMNESEVNLAILHQLRSIGIRIALDDFGTGYSSLNYLRAFPFDKIKIDRCFVEEVDQREDCQAIVRAVTSLATSLGMITTAEGVEHVGQLDQLRKEGCTQVQGYLFSKALPIAELTDLRPKQPVPIRPVQDFDQSDNIRRAVGE